MAELESASDANMIDKANAALSKDVRYRFYRLLIPLSYFPVIYCIIHITAWLIASQTASTLFIAFSHAMLAASAISLLYILADMAFGLRPYLQSLSGNILFAELVSHFSNGEVDIKELREGSSVTFKEEPDKAMVFFSPYSLHPKFALLTYSKSFDSYLRANCELTFINPKNKRVKDALVVLALKQ